ncbi:MAG: hypothetical protein Q4G51_13825, partial [Dermatophilus congolensis]|nr:hypothetical protein [Dermatophilus congolensis]
ASAGIDGAVRVWDPHTGTALHTLTGHTGEVSALAVDPNGQWLASAGDSTVRVWDPHTGQSIAALRVDSEMGCLVSDREDGLLAGGAGHSIFAFDLVSGGPHGQGAP